MSLPSGPIGSCWRGECSVGSQWDVSGKPVCWIEQVSCSCVCGVPGGKSVRCRYRRSVRGLRCGDGVGESLDVPSAT